MSDDVAGGGPAGVLVGPAGAEGVEAVDALAGLHLLGDERLLALLVLGGFQDLDDEGAGGITTAPSSSPTMTSPTCTVAPPQAMVTLVSHGTCRRPRTAGCEPPAITGRPVRATALQSRTAPSVMTPAAPRTLARKARMSPSVPALVSRRASMTRTSPGLTDSMACFCGVKPLPRAANRSLR